MAELSQFSFPRALPGAISKQLAEGFPFPDGLRWAWHYFWSVPKRVLRVLLTTGHSPALFPNPLRKLT